MSIEAIHHSVAVARCYLRSLGMTMSDRLSDADVTAVVETRYPGGWAKFMEVVWCTPTFLS